MITEEHLILIFLGKALTGHVISVHQASSEIDCTRKCLSNPKCVSFNFEIPQSRFLSICELNNVSMTSSNNKLKRNDSFAYYEPITPMERPKQEISAFCPTTSNIITDAATTQGTEEVSPTQDQAETPSSTVSSTQAATTAAPGKRFACRLLWNVALVVSKEVSTFDCFKTVGIRKINTSFKISS